MRTKNSKTFLLAASGLMVAMICAPALAQDTSDSSTKAKKKEQAAEETTVVVTGSRIRHKGAASATPTTVINSDTIRKTGTRQIADLVNQMPALVISQSDQTSNANRDKDSLDQGHPGLNALDLRGLGTKRTLVLVNGRRHVPGAPGSAAVDVSTVPSGLVERVEIVTGGASAQYGADAVAGVANFILKKNYQGVDANIRYGNSNYNDMPSYAADLLWGKNFNDGRGNVTLFASYDQSDGTVGGQDRPWTATGNPWWTKKPGSAMNTILDGRRNLGYSPRAMVLLNKKVYTFNDDGSMRNPILGPSGILYNTYNLSNNSSIANLETDGGEFGGRYDNWLLSVPSQRFITHGSFGYQLSEHARYFFEADFATNKSHGEYGLWWEGGTNKLQDGNPFITQEMINANGGGFPDGLSFVRNFPEFGKSRSNYQRDMYQFVTGFEGDLPALFRGHDWAWSTYVSYGKTKETIQDFNNTSNDRYMRALDAVTGPGGTPICAVNADADTTNDDPACKPLNPFKPVTQDVIAYLNYNSSKSNTSLEQYVWSGYVTGGIFTLPAGDVQVALGAEYRREANNIGARDEYNPDSPKFVPDYGVSETPLKGEFDVKEVFAELSVPILKDLPFAYRLTADAAVRTADYSTAGKTTAEKYGLQWAPVKDIRFRSTYGTAVRAPNISEVFTASSISGQWLSDPCNYWNLPNRVDKTKYTATNCAAAMPANKNDYWLWLDVIKKGNSDLKVETAKTLTAGVVLQPRFMKNFTATIDYYDIKMSNVISSIEPQQIINKCMDAPTLDNAYCSMIVRDPKTHNLVSVVKQNINLAKRTTSGIDMEFDYSVDLASWGWGVNAGRLGVNSVFTRLFENKYTADPDHPEVITDTVGIFGFPKLKGRTAFTYSHDKLWVGWTSRFYSGMRQTVTITPDAYAPYKTKPIAYDDVYVSYWLKPNVNLSAGLSNALNKQPPRYPGAEAGGAYFGDEGWQAGVFDVIGRTGWINLRFTR
ncbi:TonB-dependent receptor plug domain-containing protein [Asticcacaulis sp. 201]|uniref:TonB-dependent receptor plug domain-containing protein n=1 Tax=Asticcacaulis sp. 201 TaxID=3028787 RepID=UPI002915CDF3|nr:TonB-dependent receptor [Asticcacaulis sp. 201]MDV6330476.1 TonB-dependent receptor [Asticcacaulis sp. 201]